MEELPQPLQCCPIKSFENSSRRNVVCRLVILAMTTTTTVGGVLEFGVRARKHGPVATNEQKDAQSVKTKRMRGKNTINKVSCSLWFGDCMGAALASSHSSLHVFSFELF